MQMDMNKFAGLFLACAEYYDDESHRYRQSFLFKPEQFPPPPLPILRGSPASVMVVARALSCPSPVSPRRYRGSQPSRRPSQGFRPRRQCWYIGTRY
jgi:hypothetical protein